MAEGYWRIVEPISNLIEIYDGREAFLNTYAKAPLAAALLFAAHFCQSEICNGGFSQFFQNSTGVLAPEAVQGFRAIGQNRVADAIESGMMAFGLPYPRDREERHAVLEKLPTNAFDNLDDQFFKLIGTEAGGFDVAADRYAAQV